jgi:uncharacterized HAD superfamily protein
MHINDVMEIVDHINRIITMGQVLDFKSEDYISELQMLADNLEYDVQEMDGYYNQLAQAHEQLNDAIVTQGVR